MTNGDSIPTLNLDGARVEDYKIEEDPQLDFAFGGRYVADEYIQVDGQNGQPENVHKVTIELICDTDQFIAMLKASDMKGVIHVKLV
jgi:hypothetical protein